MSCCARVCILCVRTRARRPSGISAWLGMPACIWSPRRMRHGEAKHAGISKRGDAPVVHTLKQRWHAGAQPCPGSAERQRACSGFCRALRHVLAGPAWPAAGKTASQPRWLDRLHVRTVSRLRPRACVGTNRAAPPAGRLVAQSASDSATSSSICFLFETDSS